MRYIVSFSGGKDSTCLLLWAIAKYGRDNIVVVAADTGAEFPDTFEYCEYVEKKLGVKIHWCKSRKWDFYSYCRHRGKFPDMQNRFCTSDLKQGPLAVWVTANCNRKEDILLTGERWEESKRRAEYPPDYHNKKLNVKGHRPILALKTREVFKAIEQAGLHPHPVYQHFTRLGCYCCVFNTIHEWVQLAKHYPELFERVALLEEEINYTVKQGMTLRELVDQRVNQIELAL